MFAVAVVLIIGLRNMMRGGDGNFSNKMMQLRVFLQFIAIVLIVGAIRWLARKLASKYGQAQQDLYPHGRQGHDRTCQRTTAAEVDLRVEAYGIWMKPRLHWHGAPSHRRRR